MNWMCSFASTSVSLTVFFFSRISLLSSNCYLAVSSLDFLSSSVTFLILKLSSFSSALSLSNSYCFNNSLAMSFVKVSYFRSMSSSFKRSFHSQRSFLCFFISRWLPSTSGLSCNWRQSLRVDSFKSLATTYTRWLGKGVSDCGKHLRWSRVGSGTAYVCSRFLWVSRALSPDVRIFAPCHVVRPWPWWFLLTSFRPSLPPCCSSACQGTQAFHSSTKDKVSKARFKVLGFKTEKGTYAFEHDWDFVWL